MNIALYKAGLIVDPPDFPKIQSRPELLSTYLQLDDLQDCLEGYQAKIDEEEGRHMSPSVALASNQTAYFLGVFFMMGKYNFPGSSESSVHNQKLTRKLGSVCGSLTWLLWAVALLAHTQGLLNGSLGLGFWMYQAYFNCVFVAPYAFGNKDGSKMRLRGRQLYFDRCCLRYETGSLGGNPYSGRDVLDEVCPGISDLKGKETIPEFFEIQAQNPQRQQVQRVRASIASARVIIASKNAYAGPIKRQLFYFLCATLPVAGIFWARLAGVSVDGDEGMRIALECIVAVCVWVGTQATLNFNADGAARGYAKAATSIQTFRARTTKKAVKALAQISGERAPVSFARSARSDEGGGDFDILDGGNLDLWWKMLRYAHDEIEVAIQHKHQVVNTFALTAALMAGMMLLMAFSVEEEGSSQVELSLFAALGSCTIAHTGVVFMVLSSVVSANKAMHSGVLKDLKQIAIYLRAELDAGTADKERRERLRYKLARIEGKYIASMELSPMLVGRLLGARVTPEMVKKGAGALVVAVFSAVVKAGLIN
ncbi:hypothetical protein TeGR_g10614 [Tetraparma gracilis]|uniref:Odorant receptor n=1 Tax=Tetraparma gracilis TaxID=2962635 RepID=A0ABQ6MX76_9STRA|nr:hypothetical protein TeGR_g10614 [Tetraparma gracilis]